MQFDKAGITRSPSMSSPCSGERPSPISTMLSPDIASSCSLDMSARNRSARCQDVDVTIIGHGQAAFENGHVDKRVGDGGADIVVMHDGDDAGAHFLFLPDKVDDDGTLTASSEAVGSSSRSNGRAGRNPRAMLTRCCSPPEKVGAGGNRQEAFGKVEPRKDFSRFGMRRFGCHTIRFKRPRDNVYGRHARHRAQELR